MSACLSGGSGRTYALDLDIVKSPSTSTRSSQTSSPSSTLSEASNSPLAICTRKPRTPRKRPNQTYNEAAALLSTAYPNIFSTKHLAKPRKYTKQHDSFLDESPELLLPFRAIDSSAFLLHQPILEKPSFPIQSKVANFCEKPCQSPGEVEFHRNPVESCDGYEEDFDAESILDEEIEEGIDSIMGDLSVDTDLVDECKADSFSCGRGQRHLCYGNPIPMGLGFGGNFPLGCGMRSRGGVRALRHVDEENWWGFPVVDVRQISPKFHKAPVSAEKKKKKVEKSLSELKDKEMAKENEAPKPKPGLLLKLNFDKVLNAWSDRGSPFSEEIPGSELAGNDVAARLAQIDLFSEGGGVREASVLRYKDKRRTRLFSKKIRYQVRKVNADRRPRMKNKECIKLEKKEKGRKKPSWDGRFVRRPNSSTNGQRS